MHSGKGGQRMADHSRHGNLERDVEQAIIALKKGAQLLKYGRRGKPKFCPFKLSNDENALIWYSGGEEKKLWLSTVSKILSGQRTPVFLRYPRPGKVCQSFSLIYSNEERSLDLICKDKDEADVWFVGLKASVAGAQLRKSKLNNINHVGSTNATNHSLKRSSLSLTSRFGSFDNLRRESGDFFKTSSFIGSPLRSEKGYLGGSLSTVETKNNYDAGSVGGSMHSGSSSMGSDSVSAQLRLVGAGQSDNYRISMSSAVSSSSQSSQHGEDGSHHAEALGDVYMWGEGVGDGILGGGSVRIGAGGAMNLDAPLPKALESAIVLDVQYVACGGKHAALVTKQGEVFTWGEESGGRLGHGVDCDVSHPQLVEALASSTTEVVACGEYHGCAVTLSGDLYTWGDGTHSLGLLGHGNDISHWIPKRVNGPLEEVRVASIACGPWHTAVVTTAGQLFTFGDGTFGVLGHNDRQSAYSPREVESLKGLRTVRAACGVWHTAAVVEVMVGSSSASSCSSGKLFTWGDGDKGRLGHGDKEQRLVPTCVAALVDHNFRKVACGHSLTVALTTKGEVFTMGSSMFGQLGDPQADGKLPGMVEGRLVDAYVEDIACGAHHVACVTLKSEVYTWGKGANGRLGHGDQEDRNTPTLVEALKEKQVKSIACGATFTAAVCLHKWLSGADQNACSGCRQPFSFTRKRHNCYNCGLVFCHACSSKKALKASLAPNPGKPYRVCDPCCVKLRKASEGGVGAGASLSKRGAPSRNRGMEVKEGSGKGEFRVPRPQAPNAGRPPITLEFGKAGEGKLGMKRGKKPENSSSRVSPVPNGTSGGSTWGAVSVPAGFSKPPFQPSLNGPLAISSSVVSGRAVSRAVSPLSRRTSPPRSTTPTPTGSGLAIPKTVVEDLKKTNDTLSCENIQLRSHIESLSRELQRLDGEFQRSAQQLQNAVVMATEESAKSRAAKEVIKSLTTQLKEMAERLPQGGFKHARSVSLSLARLGVTNDAVDNAALDSLGTPCNERLGSVFQQCRPNMSTLNIQDTEANGIANSQTLSVRASQRQDNLPSTSGPSPHTEADISSTLGRIEGSERVATRPAEDMNGDDIAQGIEEGNRTSACPVLVGNGREPETEWVEQDEPGVYITLTALPEGGKDLRRVRFSRKRFSEREAEQWWAENRVRVHEQYQVRGGIDRRSNLSETPG
ncbi:PH, RCC1 and FYVE domains-containing protein 1 [Physcomitrium patens]|uniref:FYVE-type domain-containing protein n=1 Tax=Physcomitrium patens TaxID=3218 RepID=A0A2K1JGD1_PHYPA|nr:PH, RCC1 and FYVE domains-containing protein 1-like [Physcomitrium patens]XP_024393987.1 PH, RCC1 and FYVE domains-containing protein 1-like [Physcomitrium patens]PNR40613.1 hypothetical protein PHYPA_018016 [Physcomitrium patens]|eukprot:XP_024393986.1 PH, RCC1 and FYVE domains-containing protein 1-like [Physcomitrella patens]